MAALPVFSHLIFTATYMVGTAMVPILQVGDQGSTRFKGLPKDAVAAGPQLDLDLTSGVLPPILPIAKAWGEVCSCLWGSEDVLLSEIVQHPDLRCLTFPYPRLLLGNCFSLCASTPLG